MSDLTEAVEIAAKALFEDNAPSDQTWDSLPQVTKHKVMETVVAPVYALQKAGLLKGENA